FSYHSWIVVLIFSLRYGTTHTCCPSVANPPPCNKHTSAEKGGLLGKRKNGLRNCCSTPSRAAQILRTLLCGWLVIVRRLVLHILDLLVMVLRVRMTAIWFSSP